MISLLVHLYRTIYAKLNPINYARSIGVRVGKGVRIFSLHPGAFGSEPYLVSLEDGVIITAGVKFITHDGSTFIFRDLHPELDVMGPINILKNSFIGSGAIILPGVTIGRDCVIGAMSVVARSVPDGCVAVGIPAKVIGSKESLLKSLLGKNSGTGEMCPADKRKALMAMKSVMDDEGRAWLVP